MVLRSSRRCYGIFGWIADDKDFLGGLAFTLWVQGSRGAGGDGQIGAGAPFRPRAVVDTARGLAERIEREGQDSCRDAGTAAGDDRLVEVDATRFECRLDLLARCQSIVLEDFPERHVARARHVSGAQPGPRLRRFAAEAFGGAGIDDLRRAAR